ncbi:MAG: DMT family transporter [Acidimicrobiia bacterium]|nr:DMT family transporter [Acidimicrobiia bacterium]
MTSLSWGSAYLLIAWALRGFDPLAIAFARTALGAALLALVPSARRARVAREDWPRVVLLGLVWLAIPFTLYPIAQRHVSSSVAGMVTGGQPIAAAAIAAVLLRHLPGRLPAAGLGLGFAGVAVITLSSTGHGRSSTGSVALILAAVVCYALAANLAVPLQHRYGSLGVILRSLLVALVALAPAGLWTLRTASVSALAVTALVPLGLLSTGVGYVTFTTLVGRAGASRGAVAVYFVPVVAVVLGTAVRGEHVAAAALVGTGLVVAGAWLTGEAGRRPSRLQPLGEGSGEPLGEGAPGAE